MKNWLFLMTVTTLCCLAIASCSDEPEYDKIEIPPRDMSLAGSIRTITHIFEATGSYDGVPFKEFQIGDSHLLVDKVSDTDVSMKYRLKWGENMYIVSFPVVPLSGEPDNVTFDHRCTDATVKHNQTEHSDITASVKGWMKEVNFKETRSSPYIPDYYCNITIECIIEGKVLLQNITSIYGIY